MIDRLNTLGLPEKYDYLISKDNQLVGLEYMGKKAEVVIEPICTELTAFRSIGKVCIVYKKQGESTYTLSNKKKTEVLHGIYDFAAGPTFLYVKMDGEVKKDTHEWYSLGKGFAVVKTMGVFELHDAATNSGARVISGTRNSLDVLDRHNKTCRIMIKDASIDEVITFGDKKLNAADRPPATEYDFEFNLSTGRVKMTGDDDSEIRINTFKNIKASKAEIVSLFDSDITEDTVNKQVKRHIETYEIVYVKKVAAIKAKQISKMLSRFEENSDFSVVSLLVVTFGLKGLSERLEKGFKDIVTIENTQVIRGVRKYAVQFFIMENQIITLVLDRTSQKISYDTYDKVGTTMWGAESTTVEVKNFLCDIEEDSTEFRPDTLKLPLTINKGKDTSGNTLNDYAFDRILFCQIDIEYGVEKTKDSIGLVIFDGFSYNVKKIKSRKKEEDLSKHEVHSKKFNPDDIVISTKTELFTVKMILNNAKDK